MKQQVECAIHEKDFMQGAVIGKIINQAFMTRCAGHCPHSIKR